MSIREVRADWKDRGGLTWKKSSIKSKSDACKFNGIVVHCRQDEDNSNLFSIVWGSKSPFFSTLERFRGNFYFSAQYGQKVFYVLWLVDYFDFFSYCLYTDIEKTP